MATRIAVLFDAENINCDTARRVMTRLSQRGSVPIRRAVGDFSLAALHAWIDCARELAIDLTMQPGLGKGKNGADMRLAIEAMDIAHGGLVNTLALVTHDGDFSPLAQRLRGGGLTVLGYSLTQPHEAFRNACSEFEQLGEVKADAGATPPPKAALPLFTIAELDQLRKIAASACGKAQVSPSILATAIEKSAPRLRERIGGAGKFVINLEAFGIVRRVGSGPSTKVQALGIRLAS